MNEGPHDPGMHRRGQAKSTVHPHPKDRAQASTFVDETVLLARASGGDQTAFRVLVDRHLSLIVAGVRRLLGDSSEAEDVAQETFVRLWQRAGDLEIGEAGVRPWLRRVSRNLAIDRLRTTKRLDVVAEVPEQSHEATQHEYVEDKDRSDDVASVLAKLPDRQRIALMLFHFEGLSQAEVAQTLSCSVDAVESLLSRARRRLKVDLKDAWQALMDDPERAS